jgi:hypothetical protein
MKHSVLALVLASALFVSCLSSESGAQVETFKDALTYPAAQEDSLSDDQWQPTGQVGFGEQLDHAQVEEEKRRDKEDGLDDVNSVLGDINPEETPKKKDNFLEDPPKKKKKPNTEEDDVPMLKDPLFHQVTTELVQDDTFWAPSGQEGISQDIKEAHQKDEKEERTRDGLHGDSVLSASGLAQDAIDDEQDDGLELLQQWTPSGQKGLPQAIKAARKKAEKASFQTDGLEGVTVLSANAMAHHEGTAAKSQPYQLPQSFVKRFEPEDDEDTEVDTITMTLLQREDTTEADMKEGLEALKPPPAPTQVFQSDPYSGEISVDIDKAAHTAFEQSRAKTKAAWHKKFLKDLGKKVKDGAMEVGQKAKAWKAKKLKVARDKKELAKKAERKRVAKMMKQKYAHTKLGRNCVTLKAYAMAAADPLGDVTEKMLPVLKTLLTELAKPSKDYCVTQYRMILKNIKNDRAIKGVTDSISLHILRLVTQNMKNKGLVVWHTLQDEAAQCVGHQIHCKQSMQAKKSNKYTEGEAGEPVRKRYHGQWIFIRGPQVGFTGNPAVLRKIATRTSEVMAAANKLHAQRTIQLVRDQNAVISFSKEDARVLFGKSCHGERVVCKKFHDNKKKCIDSGCFYSGPWEGKL